MLDNLLNHLQVSSSIIWICHSGCNDIFQKRYTLCYQLRCFTVLHKWYHSVVFQASADAKYKLICNDTGTHGEQRDKMHVSDFSEEHSFLLKSVLQKLNLSFHTFHWVTRHAHWKSTWCDHILGKSAEEAILNYQSTEHAEWRNVPTYWQNEKISMEEIVNPDNAVLYSETCTCSL
jgi:hypothetical protein